MGDSVLVRVVLMVFMMFIMVTMFTMFTVFTVFTLVTMSMHVPMAVSMCVLASTHILLRFFVEISLAPS
jgi:hypothetical protein